MHHRRGKSGCQFDTEITVTHPVHAIFANAVKVKRGGLIETICVKCGTGQCAGTDGGAVHTTQCVANTGNIAAKHHGICHQMMAKCDWLCSLQVGVSRQNICLGLFCTSAQHIQQLAQQ